MNPAHDYIDRAPEPYRSIMMHVQMLIETQFPDAQLKYKWKLPFYYLNEKTMFCFLNFRKTFVDVGMPFATSLTDPHQILVAGEGRKTLRSLRYYELGDVQDDLLIETLLELRSYRTAVKN